MPFEVRAGEVLEDLMAALGRAALLLAFGLVLYALIAGSFAAWKRRRRLALSAQNALIAAFPVTLVAAVLLLVALGRRDMTFLYVWQHTSHKLPLAYALSAFWGGQEGSLLLWLLVLTGYGGLAVWLNRRSRELVAWTVPVFGLVACFFAFMLCFVSSPFNVQPAPPDGQGMVPSLQNPYMLAHPPMLYLGYVGLTVPFAFAMGALLSGRTDERWIVATRRWTLAAWTFLGVGQLIGAHWAYVEIGWGGYYAWDPVENAALMPWLAATAFLHSVMIQEKRGMLKVWNMVLVALAFNLSLFGTFLTRSGVIDSIHSFAKSSIGGWFLAFLSLMIVLSVALIRWRLPLLRTKTRLESLVSREATFLYNNLLLVALCLTILWGVLYPILSEAVRGETRSVSKPYYDFFLHTFGLPLLLLMGLGPLVAWRKASLRSLGKTFLIPFAAAVVTGAALLALGFGSSWPGLLAYTFGVFVAASIVLEFVRGRAAAGGIVRLVGRNRRRYGGYVVHAAVVLLAIGIAGSSAYQTQREQVLKPGQSIEAAGYTLTYTGLKAANGPNYTGFRALLDVRRGRSRVASLDPGQNNYAIEGPANEASIYHDPRSIGDVFTTAQLVKKGSPNIDVKVFVKPLVNLIWVAGFVFVAGALIAMWPDAVEQRRLAARYAAGAAPAGI
ncbi:MAG TPA: cytochrome c-type biogenesis CcmF C-terminal domain-containing protein [Gaiellaceae bacterium]|nr:cytochrome c-type biogenesis CcmF C-terminal domain-containing protein [Gaiellaceae bacterium]